jgi:ATP-dependent Zn protease
MRRSFFTLVFATASIGCSLAPSRPGNLVAELAALDEYEARKTADHEGGHAAYALIHPEIFDLVSTDVNDHGDGLGGATTVVARIRRGDPREKIITYLAYQFAGKTADQLLDGGTPLSSGNDEAKAARRADELLAPGEDREAALAEAQKLARRELARHKADLERLAKALQERKLLSGAEAAAIWNSR